MSWMKMQTHSLTVDGAYRKAKKKTWLHRYTKNNANSCFRHSLVTEKKSFQAAIQIFKILKYWNLNTEIQKHWFLCLLWCLKNNNKYKSTETREPHLDSSFAIRYLLINKSFHEGHQVLVLCNTSGSGHVNKNVNLILASFLYGLV